MLHKYCKFVHIYTCGFENIYIPGFMQYCTYLNSLCIILRWSICSWMSEMLRLLSIEGYNKPSYIQHSVLPTWIAIALLFLLLLLLCTVPLPSESGNSVSGRWKKLTNQPTLKIWYGSFKLLQCRDIHIIYTQCKWLER